MKKDEDVSEEKTSHQRNSEIFYNIDCAKDKKLKADSELEKRMTICQGREKMLAPLSCSMSNKKKKASTIQTTLFLQRNKTL